MPMTKLHKPARAVLCAAPHKDVKVTKVMELTQTLNAIESDMKQGRFKESYGALTGLLQTHANIAKVHYLKGICEQAARQFEHAAASFGRANQLEPANVETLAALGQSYLAASQFEAAEAALKAALQIPTDIDSRQITLDLANALHRQNKTYAAIQIILGAEVKYPDDTSLMNVRGRLAASRVPLWHIPMLAHDARNRAYETAIKSVIKAGDIVLDIGTGSGLLAMMAIRAGAAHVYACELNPVLASAARDIIDRNGFSDKITLIEKHSSQIKIGEDMPAKADVMVTEIFDNGLVGEGALPTIGHAWQALLKPEARIIPEAATLKARLISSPHFESYHNIGEVCGFDLSPMAALAHPLGYKDINFDFSKSDTDKALSKPLEVFTWDFKSPPDQSFAVNTQTKATDAGTANAVMMWFDLHLTKGINFSTENPHPQDHWREVCQTIRQSLEVKKGANLTLQSSYNRYFDFKLTANN